MNSYLNVWSSLMNVGTRFKAANTDLTLGDITDFDDTDGEELPPGNLMGVYQVDYREDNSLIYANCSFPISTEKDVSSLLLNDAAGRLAAMLKVGSTHPFYNYKTSTVIGHMRALNDLSVSPMIRTSSRQFKFVLQGFVFDRASSFLP